MNKKNNSRVTAKELQLPAEAVTNVTRSLRLAFIHADEPPADQVIVYPQSVQKDADEEGYINATVKIVKDYCGLKSHKVNVKVKVNSKWNCLPQTLQYI